jgi:hypothetical protein
MRKPLTGEPYAGELHVRFGGRGGVSLPYPYQQPGHSMLTQAALAHWGVQQAFAGLPEGRQAISEVVGASLASR